MYTKQEASAIKRKFWTTFGLYMKPVPSAWHEKVNWLNYKTGIRDVYFRMHADQKMASISIELTHGDEMIRQIFFEHFTAMKGMLHEALAEEWDWLPDTHDEWGKPVSIIQKEIAGVNIMDEKYWPALIVFFKPRLIALDSFWGDVKDSMEGW
jgi:Domain of unknown function (DUF4268)